MGQQTPAVSIGRDGNGRVASVWTGANVSTYGWRADGRLAQENSADGNALLHGYDAVEITL